MRLFLGCMYSVEKMHQCLKREGEDGTPEKPGYEPQSHKAFMQLGEEWNLKIHVLKQLEEFTCLMYGQNRESSMDSLRAKPLRKIVTEHVKLTSKYKVVRARLPPCHSARFEATPPAGELPRSYI